MSFCNNCKKRVEKTRTLYGECYLEGELQFQDSFELCRECEKLFLQYGNYEICNQNFHHSLFIKFSIRVFP